MKVTVERAQLLKSLGHVHRVVERRNTIPILGNVLVRAESAKLSLKATDLDIEISLTAPARGGGGKQARCMIVSCASAAPASPPSCRRRVPLP